jgi:hypothetical protein
LRENPSRFCNLFADRLYPSWREGVWQLDNLHSAFSTLPSPNLFERFDDGPADLCAARYTPPSLHDENPVSISRMNLPAQLLAHADEVLE